MEDLVVGLINQVIDIVDDVNKGILKKASIPEQFKTAGILTAEEREALPKEDFALVIMTKEGQELKKFPVNDAANTWLSCHYFSNTHEVIPDGAMKIAASNLKVACALYDLPVPEIVKQAAVEGVQTNIYEESTKSEDKVIKVAYDSSHSQGTTYYALGNRYPMPTPEFVKKAEEYFDRHWHDFKDASDRYEFAKNVSNRAKELSVKVASTNIKKYASDSFGSVIAKEILVRKDLLDGNDKLSSALNKLASHVEDTDPSTFAKALHIFDKKAGIEKYYDRGVRDAYRATFENSEEVDKLASFGYRWEDAVSGVSVDEASLVKCADTKYDKIKGYFGPTLADSLKKQAVAIFESLPNDAKVVIAKIANGSI